MTEPQQILVDRALDVLREAARPLRERGWPVELNVDAVPERDTFVVSLRFELPSMHIPVEARTETLKDARTHQEIRDMLFGRTA